MYFFSTDVICCFFCCSSLQHQIRWNFRFFVFGYLNSLMLLQMLMWNDERIPASLFLSLVNWRWSALLFSPCVSPASPLTLRKAIAKCWSRRYFCISQSNVSRRRGNHRFEMKHAFKTIFNLLRSDWSYLEYETPFPLLCSSPGST